MKPLNELKMQLESRSVNEGYARTAVSAFISQLDPTIEELIDIRTSVSEAVTNCIVHAYKNSCGKIYIDVKIYGDGKTVTKIRDRGRGIEDIKKARQPLFTTLGGDRSGLGFSVMESFSDKVRVTSTLGKGTTVTLYKTIKGKEQWTEKS